MRYLEYSEDALLVAVILFLFLITVVLNFTRNIIFFKGFSDICYVCGKRLNKRDKFKRFFWSAFTHFGRTCCSLECADKAFTSEMTDAVGCS